MAQQFFEELSRCLRKEQIESYNKEDRRLEIFLHGQPVLSVSPGNEVFLLPAGSKNPEANELYANQKMKNLGLSAAEHGYVSWNGSEILYEYSQPPSSPTMSM